MAEHPEHPEERGESRARWLVRIVAPVLAETAAFWLILTLSDRLDALARRVLTLETVLEAERAVTNAPSGGTATPGDDK